VSFFVSENLRGLISEDDLAVNNHDSTWCYLKIGSDSFKIMCYEKLEKGAIYEVSCTLDEFEKLMANLDMVVDTWVVINNNKHLRCSGSLNLKYFEINKEDNYVICQILIN
tara:strand:- start:571 stop:903 length:333 start_codon:yes stop_codon:yes gene_type:complete